MMTSDEAHKWILNKIGYRNDNKICENCRLYNHCSARCYMFYPPLTIPLADAKGGCKFWEDAEEV